jgi:1-acyl-sn-glycerol-3-phosphate acyltransferase
LFFPQTLKGYKYIPYHAPEENNFYKHPLISRFMRQAKSIPLIRGKGVNQEGVNRLISAVKNGGMLHIYPEGTRSRDGEIGKPKLGIGRIVYETGALVLPLYHQGLERILPIGAKSLGFGREIRIAIGKPIYFEDELKMNNNIQTWRVITERIMESIHQQHAAANARWGFKPVRVKLISSTKTVQQ